MGLETRITNWLQKIDKESFFYYTFKRLEEVTKS